MPGLSEEVGPLTADEAAAAGAPGGLEERRRGGDRKSPALPSFSLLLLAPPLPAPPAPSPRTRSPSLRFRERRPVPGLRLVQSAVSQVRKCFLCLRRWALGKFRLLAPAQGGGGKGDGTARASQSSLSLPACTKKNKAAGPGRVTQVSLSRKTSGAGRNRRGDCQRLKMLVVFFFFFCGVGGGSSDILRHQRVHSFLLKKDAPALKGGGAGRGGG